ncbi:MAG: hypothetical protein N4A40_13925 [Tissierellales bacterium]|jgi:hypothetical protein|nr:hypothetical protein [Tissierellales bacterium]
MFNISTIENLSNCLRKTKLREVTVNNCEFVVKKGIENTINNQNGDLAEKNFLGKDLELQIIGDDLKIPICIQLYENISNYYRIFVYNNKGMLTSVNLSKGYSSGMINFEISLKLSSRHMDKEERKSKRDMMAMDISREGIRFSENNKVYFGKYDTNKNQFIDTTAKQFCEELLKVAIIKGHYMENKGYELNCL